MPTPSSRLGLLKPSTVDPFVTADLATNLQAIDDAPGLTVCTSTTRPTDWTGAQAGMWISETDTGNLVRWTGTAWAVSGRFVSTAAGVQPLIAKMAVGATANGFEVQGSDASIKFHVDKDGGAFVGTAPVITTANIATYAHLGPTGPQGLQGIQGPAGSTAGTAAAVSSGTFGVGNYLSITSGGWAAGHYGVTDGSFMRVNADGTIFRSATTSARRFKKDIAKAAPVDADALLGLQPITFVYDSSHPEVEAHEEALGTQFGLIGEDLLDAGLTDLLEFTKDGQVATVRYDRIVVALLPIVRDLRAKVAAFSDRTAAKKTAAAK